MTLTGFTFVLFLLASALVYWLVPKRAQWVVLLIASAVFYLSFGLPQAGYVLVTALLTYAFGRFLGGKNIKFKQPGADKKRLLLHKRALLFCSLLLNLALLILLKYMNRIFPSASGWIAPLGISFYTLSAIGYLIDLYYAKYEPEKNPLRLLLWIGLFLQIVQGPFARYDQIGRQLRQQHQISYDNIKLGALRILWGTMKKVVIADWLGVYVGDAMGSPSEQTAPVMIAAMVLYTVQLYCDFSGYMDIVCGAGQIFLLQIPENFDRPLGSHSVAEYWRRWHMTLGAWFKDYVFYPASVSRPAIRIAKALRTRGSTRLAKLAPAVLALCAVWPLTGLWHGASVNYLIWGLLNGVAIVTSMLMEPVFKRWKMGLRIDEKSRWWGLFTVARTFLLLAVIRIFARATTLPEVLHILAALGNWAELSLSLPGALFPEAFRKTHMAYCSAAILMSAIMFFVESRGSVGELLSRFNRAPLLLKYAVGISLLYVVILLGATGEAVNATFLYANF